MEASVAQDERKYATALPGGPDPEKPGALDDLERALVDQAAAIDRLTSKVMPLTDPHGFGDLVEMDEPRPARSRLRELIAAAGANTERLRRLTAELDV